MLRTLQPERAVLQAQVTGAPLNGRECRMTRELFVAALGFGALILAAGQANAQTRACGERAHVMERLADRYGETRQSIGLGANNQVVEVFASLETGTWTITVTNPQGRMCLVASGQAYEAVSETLEQVSGDDA